MIRTRITYLFAALLPALVIWLVMALVDFAYAPRGDFSDWLFMNVPARTAATRAVAAAVAAFVAVAACGLRRRLRAAPEASFTEEGGRAIFDASDDAIFVLDMYTGVILDANYKASEMYGYAPQELRRLDFSAISSGKPPYADKYVEWWLRKAMSEGPQQFEWLAKDRGGKVFWTEMTLKRVHIEGADRTLAIARDVTRHKARIRAQMETEAKYRAVFASSPVAIACLDADGRLVEINDRLTRWLGFDESELVGRKISDLPCLHESSRQRAREAHRHRMRGERVPPYELEFVDKAGTTVICEIYADILSNEQGGAIGEIVMIVNVNDRKRAERALVESEKKYRVIFETSPEAIVLLSTKGHVLDVNGRVFDWLGYTPEEVRGKHLLKIPFLPLSSRVKGFRSLIGRLRGRRIKPYALTFLNKQGEEHVGMIRARTLRDENGAVTGDLVLITDVTGERHKQVPPASDARGEESRDGSHI